MSDLTYKATDSIIYSIELFRIEFSDLSSGDFKGSIGVYLDGNSNFYCKDDNGYCYQWNNVACLSNRNISGHVDGDLNS